MDPRMQRILVGVGSLIAVLLAVLIVVLVTRDDGSTVAAESTTTSAAAGTTTTSETTTTQAETTSSSTSSSTSTTTSSSSTTTTTAATTTTAPACAGLPSATIPGPEPGVTFAIGDFDGDGADDELIGYEDAGGSWWVQLALSYGYATETAVIGPVTAVGATDFGGAQDVGYAYVDHGASTQLLGFFFLPGCDVFEVTVDGGGVARFPIGGGVQHLNGLTCVSDGIITKSATTSDGSSWEYTTSRWDWIPGLVELQQVSSSVTLLSSPDDDDVIFSAGSLDCPETSP